MSSDPSTCPVDPTATDPEAVSTRRGMLLGVGLAGLAGTLAACGGSGKRSDGGGNGGALARTSDIPVGGGKVFKDRKVVVTQPTQGRFEAFSAVCTHRGCLVDKVADGTIDCPCHGSRYRISDASVVAGPAPKPLARKKIEVRNGEIELA